MKGKKLAWLGVFACMAMVAAAPVYSQTPSASCSTNQNAAVECFVTTAVETQLLAVHDGMNLAQFQAYGVAVSKILQQQQTYVVLGAMASAIADALPPTDADGEADSAAQRTANESIVVAEIDNGIVATPADVTSQQMVFFSQDVVNAMNEDKGLSLSPGILLRIIDSYVVTATSNGAVNWVQVDSGLGKMLTNLIQTDVVKLPSSITPAQVQKFIQQVAQIIYNYRRQTGRTSL
jgi:hypothetical protein